MARNLQYRIFKDARDFEEVLAEQVALAEEALEAQE
jgi:hypothetical protein